VFELARLLRDRAVGGFEVSLLVDPTGAELRQELGRFLADRAACDLVVVHLVGRLVCDVAGEQHLCGPRAIAGGPVDAGALPVALLEQELRRCRSERIVLVLDCPPTGQQPPHGPAEAGTCGSLTARLGGSGRAVYPVSTAAVIGVLSRAAAHTVPAELAGALLLPVSSGAGRASRARSGRSWAAAAAAMPVSVLGLFGLGGTAGEAMSVGAAASSCARRSGSAASWPSCCPARPRSTGWWR
jgi:hypothetical protein